MAILSNPDAKGMRTLQGTLKRGLMDIGDFVDADGPSALLDVVSDVIAKPTMSWLDREVRREAARGRRGEKEGLGRHVRRRGERLVCSVEAVAEAERWLTRGGVTGGESLVGGGASRGVGTWGGACCASHRKQGEEGGGLSGGWEGRLDLTARTPPHTL
jgi:hypothetical protein